MDTWIKTHEEEAATDKITDNPNPRLSWRLSSRWRMRLTPEEDGGSSTDAATPIQDDSAATVQMGQIEELGPSGPSYKPYVSQELTPKHLALLQNLIYQLSVFMQFLN